MWITLGIIGWLVCAAKAYKIMRELCGSDGLVWGGAVRGIAVILAVINGPVALLAAVITRNGQNKRKKER